MLTLSMSPAPGEKVLRFAGDRIRIELHGASADFPAFLRTNIGMAGLLRAEIISSYWHSMAAHGVPRPQDRTPVLVLPGTAWRDVPLTWNGSAWFIELTVAQVGYFEAKAYVLDSAGRQHWPAGQNVGITVHPNRYRTGNTIYCAFTRMFGPNKTAVETVNETLESELVRLDRQGYAAIPPSGTFRDLQRELPHIFEKLNCKILHLLPVNPTPTTYARFGRFGSPYACEDLTAVDPALVEFDKRTTGVEQFCELTYAVHAYGGRVFLDMVINHTGWGSTLQERFPHWFLREHNGDFASPGAWGTIWEDLVELDHRVPLSWDYLAEAFLVWCRRGVDGFRCDAGYKVPLPAWQYIIARVREEFPDCLFLLEGLGGAWEATESLLCAGGMQWAYSELFQNYSPLQVSGYMDHANYHSARVGLLVHYSETHDNDRMAKKGRNWSLLRNQLCALTSPSGGFGFTCGVEWLAPERVNVHSSRGLAWGNPQNIIPELGRLNTLLREHPCFFDSARLTRISPPDSAVYVLQRTSADLRDQVIVAVNLSAEQSNSFSVNSSLFKSAEQPVYDLISGRRVDWQFLTNGDLEITLNPGAAVCLSASDKPRGVAGEKYLNDRAIAHWAIDAISQVLSPEQIGPAHWMELAELVSRDPVRFVGALNRLDPASARIDLLATLKATLVKEAYSEVTHWQESDVSRITMLPPRHWLLVQDKVPFRATLRHKGEMDEHRESIKIGMHWFALFAPRPEPLPHSVQQQEDSTLRLERYHANQKYIFATLRPLKVVPEYFPARGFAPTEFEGLDSPITLLTNGRGGMARLCVDLGRIKSKYDCLLGANLHPEVPVDRHVFAKRVRVWANANQFFTALTARNLLSFQAGPPARWQFQVPAGNGRAVVIELVADMIEGENSTILQFRTQSSSWNGGDFPPVRIIARVDIEDRSFHAETMRNQGSEAHFTSNINVLVDTPGFAFTPAPDRQLRVYAASGDYYPGGEWSLNLPHEVERTRGQTGSGDAYSPGWFDLPLNSEAGNLLVITSEKTLPELQTLLNFADLRTALQNAFIKASAMRPDDLFGKQLALAAQSYVVKRHSFKTVIAGYPWFLDWGRDSLICARGLISAGMTEEVRQLLVTFGRFEKEGTMPNTIHGEDASNRDTSDAPLWYGIVTEELVQVIGPEVYETRVDSSGRTVAQVLLDLATGISKGTPNGIRMDPHSGLIWSPKHFTWMDTNYPAGTPREGYPIEIQALWIRLLRQVALRDTGHEEHWKQLAEQAEKSLHELFWLRQEQYPADCLRAAPGVSARNAQVDDALRSNALIAVTLGFFPGAQARATVAAAAKHLIVPGGLRSLAPLPVKLALPIHGNWGGLLNDPNHPYWGEYQGDEDTRRKPAYHNGTAWTWTFPGFCEALAQAWDFSPEAVAAARSYLGSMDRILMQGCLGHMPEIMDGNAPHQQRGCDAQAWGMTEALRVWKLLDAYAT
ncbi:MAG: amylo-alpha-1,6-glucosidase [Verrucomicrobiota bacterium]|nr:amylo-alpha-1,6-glucosidase [Verrucomicrobiota bacterium]